ncbi:MAG: hypothetical protein HQ538_01115 [Parcubacteria group bacterium]|nr:hypothetical protein [Parcubacteria group bacterium]
MEDRKKIIEDCKKLERENSLKFTKIIKSTVYSSDGYSKVSLLFNRFLSDLHKLLF